MAKTKSPPATQPIKAYHNLSFIDGTTARPIRMLAEYIEPRERFERRAISDTILFFGSARIVSTADAEARLEAVRDAGGDTSEAETQLRMSTYYEATRELAYRLTNWSKELKGTQRRFVVCSGGGPGIMEAANRGASEAKGINIGLGISLPFEEASNAYVTRDLNFEFHYFFMRKFWFLYLAKALVIMPGGFGTLDELFECLTLLQTAKIKKRLPIVLFGSEFWEKVINIEAMVGFGTISAEDLERVHRTDSVDDAFKYVTNELAEHALERPGAYL